MALRLVFVAKGSENKVFKGIVSRCRMLMYMVEWYKVTQNKLGRCLLSLVPRNSKEWHGYSGK